MRYRKSCLALAALPLLGGCIVKTAVDVATVPVKVVGKGVDMATTSQSEADEKRDQERAKLDREYRKRDRQCREGNRSACEKRDAIARRIESLDSAGGR
ncbi:MAG: hypothetical protein J7496_07850 [Novosphingobium sp.]|nr:hypothetical protein [Novosphingobium sp.]MBO9602405.1 hypothetical protein [Novosphingobium sp.]